MRSLLFFLMGLYSIFRQNFGHFGLNRSRLMILVSTIRVWDMSDIVVRVKNTSGIALWVKYRMTAICTRSHKKLV